MAERLVPALTIHKPFGLGPWPVLIMLHGCGGMRPFFKLYARRGVEAGYAVVEVDSFKPRGVSRLTASLTVCTGMQLQGAERAADLFAIYDWLRRQSWADDRRIVAAGWSHGAWTIMDALAAGDRASRLTHLSGLPARPLEGLRGVFLIYPYCSFPAMTAARGWHGQRPNVYAILGGRDQVVGMRFPKSALARLERDGVQVKRLELPEATHAFEDEGASDPRSEYRPDLTEAALKWFGAALSDLKA